MKANQNFRQADDAVSPVIGVILMVAITVVLAAVVFVLVSDLGDQGSNAPDLGFSKDEQDDQLTVSRADTGLNWTEFEIRADQDVTYTLNGLNSTDLAENVADEGPARNLRGGDVFAFCGTGATASLEDVTITIRHIESNSQVASFEFTTISAC